MHLGFQYLIDKGFRTIVLYSDMETDVASLIEQIKQYDLTVYTIITDSRSDDHVDDLLKTYLDLNKDYLRVR